MVRGWKIGFRVAAVLWMAAISFLAGYFFGFADAFKKFVH